MRPASSKMGTRTLTISSIGLLSPTAGTKLSRSAAEGVAQSPIVWSSLGNVAPRALGDVDCSDDVVAVGQREADVDHAGPAERVAHPESAIAGVCGREFVPRP